MNQIKITKNDVDAFALSLLFIFVGTSALLHKIFGISGLSEELKGISAQSLGFLLILLGIYFAYRFYTKTRIFLNQNYNFSFLKKFFFIWLMLIISLILNKNFKSILVYKSIILLFVFWLVYYFLKIDNFIDQFSKVEK